MNDIYKQKAEKYKYKYLKLKQELYSGDGGGYECTYDLPILFDNNSLDFGSNEPGEPGNPGKLKIVTNYPPNTSNTYFNNFNKKNYTGIILKHQDYTGILSLLTSPNIVKYTKVVYACTINKEVRNLYFKRFRENNHIKDKFIKCPIFNNSDSYGYIITENILGKTYPEDLITDIDLFIQFINNLIKTLTEFIQPLHTADYILNNIDISTIKWDKTQVYFNINKITKITKNTDKYKDIKNLIYLIYYITKLLIFNDYHYTKDLLKEFDKDKNMSIDKLINNLPKINECIKYEKQILEYEEQILEYESKEKNPSIYNDLNNLKNKKNIAIAIDEIKKIKLKIHQ
jgi:hypothetical protein